MFPGCPLPPKPGMLPLPGLVDISCNENVLLLLFAFHIRKMLMIKRKYSTDSDRSGHSALEAAVVVIGPFDAFGVEPAGGRRWTTASEGWPLS